MPERAYTDEEVELARRLLAQAHAAQDPNLASYDLPPAPLSSYDPTPPPIASYPDPVAAAPVVETPSGTSFGDPGYMESLGPAPVAAPAAEPAAAPPGLTYAEQGFHGPALDLMNMLTGQTPQTTPQAEPASKGVALPQAETTEEAEVVASEEAPPVVAPVAAPDIPQAGPLSRLGANAVAQAEVRQHLHGLEAGRKMDEAEARERAETTKKERMVRWNETLGELEEELQYFGMDPDDVRAAKALLERSPGPDWTEDDRQNLLRKQALAKSNLQSARSINTAGPFRHMASKFLAALSVGAGSWAAVRTGRNPAMELYKGAIERDIAAQKAAYSTKSAKVGRHINTYDRIKSEIGDELASTLLLASLEYGAAEQVALGQLEQLKGKAQKFAYQQQAATLRATKEKLKQEAMAAYLEKQLEVDRSRDIGVLGVTYVGRKLPDGTYDKGMVPDKQEVKKIKEAGAAYKKYMRRIASLMEYAGEVSWIGDYDKKKRAKYAWEDVISLAGNLHEKGVLQEFERKTLEAVFPEPGGIIDNLGLLKPSLEEFQRRAENDWKAFMATKTHYHLDTSLGKAKWGVKAPGQRK